MNAKQQIIECRDVTPRSSPNRLFTLIHSNSTAQLARFDYTLNAVGNRTSKTQTGGSGFGTTAEQYAYDAIDQIIGVDYSLTNVITRSVSYQYDPVGNRQQVQEQAGTNAVTTAYTANVLNQYTVVGADVPIYDANGNLGGQAGWSYTYDAQNRLVSATDGTSTTVFSYDARNRCVARKTTQKGVQYFMNPTVYLTYDGWNLIEERDATGNLLDKYIHGANVDEILVRYNGGAIYYHHDGLGSVTHLTDATGSVVESYQYDVYGAVSVYDSTGSPVTTPPITRFTYTGREYLAELGLYDYRNRMYSQTLGRFLQTDPIRFKAGDINLYRYVQNTPAKAKDPSGLTNQPGDEGWDNFSITVPQLATPLPPDTYISAGRDDSDCPPSYVSQNPLTYNALTLGAPSSFGNQFLATVNAATLAPVVTVVSAPYASLLGTAIGATAQSVSYAAGGYVAAYPIAANTVSFVTGVVSGVTPSGMSVNNNLWQAGGWVTGALIGQ